MVSYHDIEEMGKNCVAKEAGQPRQLQKRWLGYKQTAWGVSTLVVRLVTCDYRKHLIIENIGCAWNL